MQYDFGVINPDVTSGTSLATMLNNFRTAVLSSHSGTSRPSYVTDGMIWSRPDAPANMIHYSVYAGGLDIPLGSADITMGAWQPAGLPNGTAENPGQPFRWDPDTGPYLPALGQYAISCDGVQALLVSQAGVTAKGDVTGLSDRRAKENIRPIRRALERVALLEGVTFDWRRSGLASAGVIAQDVEVAFPEVVRPDPDPEGEGHLMVNYNGLVGLLVEAVKELAGELAAVRVELAEHKRPTGGGA